MRSKIRKGKVRLSEALAPDGGLRYYYVAAFDALARPDKVARPRPFVIMINRSRDQDLIECYEQLIDTQILTFQRLKVDSRNSYAQGILWPCF